MADYKNAQEIYRALEQAFRPWECTEVFSTMGLQLDHTDVVKKVYTATFVSDEVMDQIESRGDTHCLLFTHHPVPQKKDLTKDSPPPLAAVDRAAESPRHQRIQLSHPFGPGEPLVSRHQSGKGPWPDPL